MKVSLEEKMKRIRPFLVDSERKPFGRILTDIASLWVSQRQSPQHYYGALLYKKYATTIDGYIGCHASAIRTTFNSAYWFPVLDNKLFFHEFFRDTPVRTARLLGYSLGQHLFADGKCHTISSPSAFSSLVDELIMASETGSVFAKSAGAMGGQGCWVCCPNDSSEYRNRLHQACIQTGFVFEETISQHSEMARMHPTSVNTLRIDTFKDQNGATRVISAFMRMGTRGRYVDNATSGGCFAGVDIETGNLRRYGYTLPKHGGSRITAHPDTGVVFEQFSVPCLSDALQLAQSAATYAIDRMVGWDVAIAPDGPVLIEANPNYDTRMSEVAYGGYLRNPVYRDVLAEYKTRGGRMRFGQV